MSAKELTESTKLKLAYEMLFKKQPSVHLEDWQIARDILQHRGFDLVLCKGYCAWIIYYLAHRARYSKGVDCSRLIRQALDMAPRQFGKPDGTDSGMSQVEFWYLKNIEAIERSIQREIANFLLKPV